MATLAASAVTVRDSWYEGGPPTLKKTKVKSLTLVLTGHGGATNTILASTLGFTTIREVSAVQSDDDSVVTLGAPSYDGTKLFLYDLSNATDATRDAPTDITDTVRCIVKGT